MKAVNLQVCNLKYPLGIDVSNPRFTWNCEGGTRQTAFRLVVYTSAAEILCDSGIVTGDAMNYRYNGRPLQSREILNWKVCLWDSANNEFWSEESRFEMGLLLKSDWNAKWISGVNTNQRKRLPADYYRIAFSLDKKVLRARLYATACGVYSAVINGKRLPGVLTPGCSEYEKHLYYQTYDVTNYISMDNCVIFCVADGWYKGKVGSDNTEYLYGIQTMLLAQLEIIFTDGSSKVLCTTSDFDWCNDGPVRETDLKDGEIYDARMIPSFSQHALETDYHQIPSASNSVLILEQEHFTPTLEVSPSGSQILNFGQNLAGYIQFQIKGNWGQKIILHMFEVKDNGEYSNTSINGRCENLQRIVYICDGKSSVFQPEFFYSGFQYAMVEGLEQVNPSDFTSIAVYSDIAYNSSFHCSNPLINQFVSNTLWSQKSNFVDLPTDCPHREKSGWTGDAQLFARTASYFADTAVFYRKWLKDVRDCQRENGLVVDVAPRIRDINSPRDAVNGSSGWADAAVIIPYILWKFYGDESFITDNYQLMHNWSLYMRKICSDKSMFHLPEGHPLKEIYDQYKLPDSPWNQFIPEAGIHWGEWCEPDFHNKFDSNPQHELLKPKQEVTTAYLFYSMTLLEEMLLAIGKEEEAKMCHKYSHGAKCAYQHHFKIESSMQEHHMAELVRPLTFGLFSDEAAVKAAAELNKMAVSRHYKVGTGFLSTPFLLQTLCSYGYTDTAYRMLENTEAPGWLAMPSQGATTVWEHYTGYTQDGHPRSISFNHYSPGSICAFLFDTVCGIQIEGQNHFSIKPLPGGSLTHASASFASPYGIIKSCWKRNGNEITYTFTIPSNTTACAQLPDGNCHHLVSGTHVFHGLL